MRIKSIAILAAAAALSGAAVAQTPTTKVPVAGYLGHPGTSLIRLETKWVDAKGYPLYVLDRECNAQCARLFPPLTPIVGAKPPTADWSIRTREENGDMQWVYKGKPVYVYSGDYVDRPEKKLPDGSTQPASEAQPPKADLIVPWVHLAKP